MRDRIGRMTNNNHSKIAERPIAGCESCGGSGVVRGTGTVPCAACNATGRVMDEHCPACRGLEFQVVEIDTPCHRCNGSGYVEFGRGSEAEE